MERGSVEDLGPGLVPFPSYLYFHPLSQEASLARVVTS